MDKTEKAVIYARVSTDKQNYTEQVEVLKGWGENLGLEVTTVYTETESAWKEGHQVELQNLVKAAYQHRFKVVLVWALDRLTREGALGTLQLVHRLKTYGGVRVYSFQEQWTLAPGEIADILYAIVGWVAEMESKRRSERTKMGIASKRKKNGGGWGRPRGKKDSKPRKRRTAKNL